LFADTGVNVPVNPRSDALFGFDDETFAYQQAIAATVNGARAAGLEHSIGTLTPGKQTDIILVRTNGVAVFPVTNAIGTIVQAVEHSDVDTVMVAGEIPKRAATSSMST
jgi:cytosine/adenosine deaminase-related metal-dependent hydrolase